MLDEISQITQAVSDFDLNGIFLSLKELDQNYKIPNIYAVEDEKTYKKPAVKEIKELSDKITKLAEPNKENIKELYTRVKTEFEAIEKFFKSIGDFVDQKNKLIVKFKSDNTDEKLKTRIASSSKRIAEIEKELAFINGNKIKEQQKKEQKEKKRKALQDDFAKLKTDYDTALKSYEKHCSTKAFSNLLSKIQDYFKKFNFSFKLELKTDPTGNKTEFPFAFKFLRKRFGTNYNEYNLIRNKKEFGGSFICKSKADKFLDKLKTFESDLAKIPSQSLDVELKVVEYGQYLRYEIERYIKNDLLHWNTNDFPAAIKGVKSNKKIDDGDLDKINKVYSFCNWTTSHVDVGDDHGLGQLKEKISDFVGIVKN